MTLKGYFDTQPSRVNYDLAFIMSDGDWKLIRINVNVEIGVRAKPDWHGPISGTPEPTRDFQGITAAASSASTALSRAAAGTALASSRLCPNR